MDWGCPGEGGKCGSGGKKTEVKRKERGSTSKIPQHMVGKF